MNYFGEALYCFAIIVNTDVCMVSKKLQMITTGVAIIKGYKVLYYIASELGMCM